MTRGIAAGLACVSLVGIAACDRSPACRGVETVHEGERYCAVAGPAVIEGGFACPPELPFEVPFEGGVACAAAPTRAEDLPEEVCAAVGGRCVTPGEVDAGGLDAGRRDAGAIDAGVTRARWEPLPDDPPARAPDGCVSTGDGLAMFGGRGGASVQMSVILAEGRRLDPAGWTEAPAAGAPSPRVIPHVAWLGERAELFVFGGDGGEGAIGTGGVWRTEAGEWAALPSAPVAGRRGAAVVWTGAEVVVWGGRTSGGVAADGAAYDPAAGRWRGLPSAGAPSARELPAAAWTGREVLVFGGAGPTGVLGDGALYDPVADRWRPLPTERAPSSRREAVALATEIGVVVWGGISVTGASRMDGAIYDPVAGLWRAIEAPPAGLVAPRRVAAAWAGGRLVFWGGTLEDTSFFGDGAAYDPAARAWSALPTGGPSGRFGHCLVSAGPDRVAVFGGRDRTSFFSDGAILVFGDR